jgi:UDP-N-acetylglucosamine 2-epimerase
MKLALLGLLCALHCGAFAVAELNRISVADGNALVQFLSRTERVMYRPPPVYQNSRTLGVLAIVAGRYDVLRLCPIVRELKKAHKSASVVTVVIGYPDFEQTMEPLLGELGLKDYAVIRLNYLTTESYLIAELMHHFFLNIFPMNPQADVMLASGYSEAALAAAVVAASLNIPLAHISYLNPGPSFSPLDSTVRAVNGYATLLLTISDHVTRHATSHGARPGSTSVTGSSLVDLIRSLAHSPKHITLFQKMLIQTQPYRSGTSIPSKYILFACAHSCRMNFEEVSTPNPFLTAAIDMTRMFPEKSVFVLISSYDDAMPSEDKKKMVQLKLNDSQVKVLSSVQEYHVYIQLLLGAAVVVADGDASDGAISEECAPLGVPSIILR